MAPLAAFLRAASAKPFAWGEHDCGLLLANWYAFLTGKDPAAELRGTYASEAECAARFGNVLKQTHRICRTLALSRVPEPLPGDIGVIELKGHRPRLAAGAIRGNGGWIVLGDSGLTKMPDGRVRVIAAWRIPECRQSLPRSVPLSLP